MSRRVIAVDIGASSGKMAFAEFDGEKLTVRAYRDFPNRPVHTGTALYWDVFALYNAITDGLAAFRETYGEADTLAIDTWGASYGLLDRQGRLLEPVYHYRDRRTDGVMEAMRQVMSEADLFAATGCQCNRTYTLPQLYSYRVQDNPVLDIADRLLFLPDLLGYFLTGKDTTETTIAGTSCLLDPTQAAWSGTVSSAFRIPETLHTPFITPGQMKGSLRQELAQTTGMKDLRLVAAAGHDSASAVAAIPEFDGDSLYISVGTNISMGVEADESLLTDEAFRGGLKNTGGADGRVIVYRDFSASWHVNEFLRTRAEQGIVYTHPQLIEMAAGVRSEVPWIDAEEADLNNAGGDYCARMDAYFDRTGQRRPADDAERIRSIYESIALRTAHYAQVFRSLYPCRRVNVISGAVRNRLLMQLIANALGSPIQAGLPYASLAGNLLIQLQALGEVRDLAGLRTISARSFPMEAFLPEDAGRWQEKLDRYEVTMRRFAPSR